MSIIIMAVVLAAVQGKLLHWGACVQDQNKCATCNVAGCACTTGTLWMFEACQSRMCMRCFQNDDGSFETQVAALTMSPTCPTAQADQAVVCNAASFKSIYSYGDVCIDLGVGASLNCIQATRDAAGKPAVGGPTTGTGISSQEPGVSAGGLSTGAIIGIAAGGAAVIAVAVAIAVVLMCRRRQAALGAASKSEREMLSPPKAKNPSLSRTTSPTQTVASPRRGKSAVQQNILEQAVNDLV